MEIKVVKQTFKSQLDQSVNVVPESNLESRYVQRDGGDTAAIYLSSQRGCDRACRMCHLTQTGQTDMTHATLEEFVQQAKDALREGAVRRLMADQAHPVRIHYNFMARGEPLLNPTVFKDWDNLAKALFDTAQAEFPGVEVKFKISTIFSEIYVRDKDGYLIDGYEDLPFTGRHMPEIYYSMYSTFGDFRRRFLPKAEDYQDALMVLSRYIQRGGKARAHGAFILMQNDNMNHILEMCSNLKSIGLTTFNIVRFNTPDPTKMREVDEDYLQGIVEMMTRAGMTVQVVQRVGDEVCTASCGMFYNPEKDLPK